MTQSPRELAAQSAKFRREQERLLQDLLGILDSLDYACEHWQQAEQQHTQAQASLVALKVEPMVNAPFPIFQHWRQALQKWLGQRPPSEELVSGEENVNETKSMGEVISSAKEGVEMMRRSLLDVLRQRQVVPLESEGQVFDPERMLALGREESEEAEENTVLREIVRGYLWQNQILREAQVMVAVKPAAAQKH